MHNILIKFQLKKKLSLSDIPSKRYEENTK